MEIYKFANSQIISNSELRTANSALSTQEKPLFISVVVTVRNEGKTVHDLLDSLTVQEPPYEVIIVDSNSTDNTREIVKSYQEKVSYIKLYIYGGKRGASRNFGVQKATGDIIAFTDGDCIARTTWLKHIRDSIKNGYDIVAGRTILVGYEPFVQLERVELFYRGYDVTYPSCNLAYRKKVFLDAGEFSDEFVTAEDIDLNIRAVQKGAKIVYNSNMVVIHRARSTLWGFIKQAFWNGYGRKQLTLKHGSLWTNYNPIRMFSQHFTFWYLIRLIVALMGYIACKFFRKEK